jgi:hypothetical protein
MRSFPYLIALTILSLCKLHCGVAQLVSGERILTFYWSHFEFLAVSFRVLFWPLSKNFIFPELVSPWHELFQSQRMECYRCYSNAAHMFDFEQEGTPPSVQR